MEVRAFGIHSIRGVLASGGVFGGELLVDERTANRRVWQLADDARAAGVKVQKIAKRRLDALCNGGNHQGVVFVSSAEIASIAPMMEFAQVVKRSAKNIIALDGVSDPQNLGAIVRTAAAFDIGAIVMARAASAPMNAAAIRVAGANANCVSIVRVGNLRRALKTLWQNDWRTIAVDERGEESFFDSVLSASRLCWVFGGEDRGLRPIVRAACELSARVPSVAGDVGCLNVAAAVAGCLALARLALRRG